MNDLPEPLRGAMIYQDEKLYVCLANSPIAEGHVVVVWKNHISDLHLLNRDDYEHLMDCVDQARNAMLKVLDTEKVYLLYMDEIRHVHWHLIPRYTDMGANLLLKKPSELNDTSLAIGIKQNWYKLN